MKEEIDSIGINEYYGKMSETSDKRTGEAAELLSAVFVSCSIYLYCPRLDRQMVSRTYSIGFATSPPQSHPLSHLSFTHTIQYRTHLSFTFQSQRKSIISRIVTPFRIYRFCPSSYNKNVLLKNNTLPHLQLHEHQHFNRGRLIWIFKI